MPVLNANTATPLTGAVAVEEGPFTGKQGHGCAALSDGTVWCWRTNADGNSYGQLGNGTIDTSGGNPLFRATQVLTAANTPLTGIKDLAKSYGPATCAVTNDGKLYCWGALDWLVNNGAALTSAYAQVITIDGATPFTGIVQASIGDVVACALVNGASANEVWCWGYNATYSLGLGDTVNRRYPTKVPGFVNPTKVAVASANYLQHGDASCVIDGSNVRCWGYNGDGGVGIGSTTPAYVTSPMLVKLQDGTTPFDGAVDLVPGYSGFCALRTGDAIWCWGSHYQLYPSNYGATNVVVTAGDDAGYAMYNPRYLTSDGVYHMGTKSRTPNCGGLQ
jgi:alpha-tubulin suppressor-like RCC1 family protein